MNDSAVGLWPLIQESRMNFMRARFKQFGPPPREALEQQLGLKHLQIIGPFLYMLENYDRFALSTEHYRVRNAYDNPSVIEADLKLMVEDGLLETSDDCYSVTERGLETYRAATAFLRPWWNLPIDSSDVDKLIAMQARVYEAMYALPHKHWAVSTRHDFGLKQADGLNIFEQWDWQTFNLWAYRDDAHLAAWEEQPVSPFAWEAFTYIWKKEANSVEALDKALKLRQWSANEWQQYLNELLEQGWIFQDGESYHSTEKGQALRDAAEAKTDELFYAPFSVLTAEEIDAMWRILNRIKDETAAILAG